jgi:hypothetical protein
VFIPVSKVKETEEKTEKKHIEKDRDRKTQKKTIKER